MYRVMCLLLTVFVSFGITCSAALPPRNVYSAIVLNKLNDAVHVTVVYTMPPDAHTEVHEFDIPAGEHVALEQKMVKQGSMTSTGAP